MFITICRKRGEVKRDTTKQKVTGKKEKKKRLPKSDLKKKVSGPPPFVYPLLRHIDFILLVLSLRAQILKKKISLEISNLD